MDEEGPQAVVPHGDRKLRACMVTGLVKTEDQWYRDGNENVPCLDPRNDKELIFEVTSANFDGMVAMMDPDSSWVAKYQAIKNYVPGCYALRVRGVLPNQHVIQLEDHGITYRSLDE